MSDFQLVDPRGWEIDLQSVYSAYMGHFQLHNVPWYERSWGHLFESFAEFVQFSWPCITVTDRDTGRAHIVTRMTSVGAFLKMVKTRFGETLPTVNNMLSVIPFETSQRPLRTVSDQASYKKLHATLPAVVLAAQKVRVRNGDASAIRELWARKDKSFLAVSFEWSERNPNTCFEWGYAALRCGHLHALGVWPPDLDTNCRKGHYVVSEYADKVHNKHSPSHPWQYAFGESHAIPKAKLAVVIQAIISSLASPDSETHANDLVLVGHGLISDLQRLEEMKIKIPRNVLVVDTVTLEHNLFATGARGAMLDPRGHPRAPNTSLSLASLLHSLPLDVRCVLHNSGNDAFLTLFAMQRLIDPDHTPAAPKWGSGTPPDARPRLSSVPGHPSTARMSPQMAYPVSPLLTPLPSGQTGYFGLDVGEQRPRVPKQVSPGGDRNSRRLSAAPSKESDARSRRVSLM